jgi:adenylate cyclase
MTSEGFRRKLTAILSADAVGYSRLMGEDEEATVRTVTAYREMMSTLIQKHQGRVVDSPGDNLLAEFASVVDAVRCAVEIQEELRARNAELPEDRKMEFRIGINLGDVIEEGERIYGDGVNIAARVEGLAEPGGICISGTVYEHIKDKLALWEEFLGEEKVKNIVRPVRVYRVRMQSNAAVSEVNRTLELPDKPSIAVLPFVNMSGDSEQEYFADGIAEDIITDLSKISGLFVIARNSSFSYRGKQAKVQHVAQDLGVRYVLEGSVRRAGDRIRVTAQLIDGKTEYCLWVERYDRELKDIFSVQDEVTQKVVSELAVTLKASEEERLIRKHTENFEAYDIFLRARRESWAVAIKEKQLKAKELCEKVVELDPNFAGGYSLASIILSRGIRFGFSTSPREDLAKAFELAQKAVSVDDTFLSSYPALASVYLMRRQHDDALATMREAVKMLPGNSGTVLHLGFYLHWVGQGEEAIQAVKKAQELNPKYLNGRNTSYLDFMGYACFTAGRYDESVAAWKKAIDRFGPFVVRQAFLTASYGELGRDDEASAMVQQLLKTNPNFALKSWEIARMYKNPKNTERLLGALRRAGLK